MAKFEKPLTPEQQRRKQKDSFKTKCPLCSKKLTSGGFENHRKSIHPDLTHKQFELVVIEAIKSGKIVVDYFEGSNSSLSSGTQRTGKALLLGANGLFHMSQGGKATPK